MQRDRHGDRRPSWSVSSTHLALGIAVLCVVFPAAPLWFGDGVDLPDDTLYHKISAWEWLRYAVVEGVSPWFVPGKLGGVSLFADVIPMGPFYPAAALLLVVPPWAAFPVAFGLHSVGGLFAFRWMARTFGVSAIPATLAGAAVAVGPIGTLHYVDFWADSLPLLVWFPVAIGGYERLQSSSTTRRRVAWAALVAAALALLMLGCHLRTTSACLAAFGIWTLVRWGRPQWGWASLALGLAAGCPGFLPYVLEVSGHLPGMSRLETLSGTAHAALGLWNVVGFVAPKPLFLDPDIGIGAVLAATLLLTLRGLPRPLHRLGWMALVLVSASLASGIAGVRWLFAPLLLVTHPINDIYTGLGVFLATVLAASGFERLARGGRDALLAGLRSPGGVVLGILVAGVVLRCAAGGHLFSTDHHWQLYLRSAAVSLAAIGLAGWLVWTRRLSPGARTQALFAVAMADLVLIAVQLHVAVPSERLALREPIPSADLAVLSDSYLDVTDLSDVQGFLYTPGEEQEYDDEGASDELEPGRGAYLLNRRWPVYAGVRHGLRNLTGRAKMPPQRIVALLRPLAEELVADQDSGARWEDVDPAHVRRLFAPPDGLGYRVMALGGVRVAVGRREVFATHDDVAPPCYAPSSLEVETSRDGLPARVLASPFDPTGAAVVEADPPVAQPAVPTSLECRDVQRVVVNADEPTVVVIRQNIHPGWQIRDGSGARLEPFPVNMVHMGVAIPAGEHELDLRFRPPGLFPGLAIAGCAWLFLAGLGLASHAGRRRKSPGGG